MYLRQQVAIGFIFCSLFLGAQEKIASPLTIDWIMQGPSLYGNTPQNIYWSPDGSKLYFSWKPASADLDDAMEVYSVNRNGRNVYQLSKEDLRHLPLTRIQEFRWSMDYIFRQGRYLSSQHQNGDQYSTNDHH